MKTISIAALSLALVGMLLGTAGCESKVDDSILNMPPGAAVEEAPTPVSKRPPPARSGIGSDPDNPSGAPGSGSGLGTSPNRY